MRVQKLFIFPILAAMLLPAACSTGRISEKEVMEVVQRLPASTLSPVDYAYQELLKNGVSPEFAELLKTQYLKEKEHLANRDRIVQLNVLGFLSPGDYSKHYSTSAVKHIKSFMKKYGRTLAHAEKELSVPKEIIASLLWVETKHGKTLGQYRLPMVYYSLMQAPHPEVAKTTLLELNVRKPASNSAAASLSQAELQQRVIQRLSKKSSWAIEQIKELESIYTHQKFSRHSLLKVKASFAGAFGCSQFIPSSYNRYALSPSHKTPDLFNMKDCIYSVANFLHKSGWDSEQPKARSDALFEYNRIRDYGDVIQKLAEASKI